MSDPLIPLHFGKRHVMVCGSTLGTHFGVAQDLQTRGVLVPAERHNAENVRFAVEGKSTAPERLRGFVAVFPDDQTVDKALRSPVASFDKIYMLVQGAVRIFLCAAKTDVDQLTRVLALELSAEDVSVNSISHGPIADTKGVHRLMPSPAVGDFHHDVAVPLGRMRQKQEIASLALCLASHYGGSVDSAKTAVEAAGSSLAPARSNRLQRGGRVHE